MNRETYEDYRTLLLDGECPVCHKLYFYRKVVWTHFEKHHLKLSNDFGDALLEDADRIIEKNRLEN